MMGSDIVLILFAFLVNGVFGDTDEVKTLLEGDPVSLNTDVTKDDNDIVKWYFNDILIAVIYGHASSSCSYDGEGGRFRGRLVMDNKTGSLNITEIRTEHTGRYEAEFIKPLKGKMKSLDRKFTCDSTKIIQNGRILDTFIKTIRLNVIGEVKTVKEGDHVFLNTGVIKDENDTVKWYFNDILLAVIDGSSSCSYDGEGERFRGRLVMDNKTGSLNITEIRTEHTGYYEAEFIKPPEGKTESLNRNFTCNSTKIIQKSRILGTFIKTVSLNVIANKNKNEAGINPNSDLSPGAVAGIVVAVVLLLAVCGVIYLRSKNGKKKNIPGLQQSSEEKLMIDKNHMP